MVANPRITGIRWDLHATHTCQFARISAPIAEKNVSLMVIRNAGLAARAPYCPGSSLVVVHLTPYAGGEGGGWMEIEATGRRNRRRTCGIQIGRVPRVRPPDRSNSFAGFLPG